MQSDQEKIKQEVVLTGLRTNGSYHLGNYIGALLPLVQLVSQERMRNYRLHLFVPDLHSFTTPIDFSVFHQQTMENLKLFVAAGIELDNPDIHLYRQSRIAAHSELTWILSTFASMGDLGRMVEFKEKSQRLPEDSIGAGLFLYPVLMAADILLYDARWVPVGEDQRQHLEFCRRLARSVNHRLQSEVFQLPADFQKQQQWLGRSQAPRIRSLRRPEKKMSKSVSDPAGTILLKDDQQTIVKKIMSATTDDLASVNFDWDRQPGVSNLLTILASLSQESQEKINADWKGSDDYQALKKATAKVVVEKLLEIQTGFKAVSQKALLQHLRNREALLNKQASVKLRQIQALMGLRK